MFSGLLEKLQRRQDLTVDEAATAMEAIMDGHAQPSHIAGLLIALAMKGERPSEIVGLARTMRARATKLSREHAPVFDPCGTGGDRAHTFNVSTVAALVLAACGVRVAKHGNRSVSSRCGSADVFEALGVNVTAEPATVERCLDEAGIAFFFAPTFHPSMRHAAPTRRELGVRTAFNLLGPLTNPAGAARQLVGVPRPELTELVARSLALLGSERAWVVHGADGLDEISTTGYTKVSECREGRVNTFYLHPSDAGIGKAAPEALRGGDAAENAAIVREVLDGAKGAARDIVLLNAAAALLVAGQVTTIADGLAAAAVALDSGGAARVLDDLRRVSNAAARAEPGPDARHGSSNPRDAAAQGGGSVSPGSRPEHGASAPPGRRSVASP
jgi:anthranilate phosphoribosyltransferase